MKRKRLIACLALPMLAVVGQCDRVVDTVASTVVCDHECTFDDIDSDDVLIGCIGAGFDAVTGVDD